MGGKFMINPKNICVSSCVGFCLSFFIGLFSDVRFASVLFRAFMFAVMFALLCIGISFIYQKFLSNDVNGSFSESDQAPVKTAGGVVNIVVDDSVLPEDAQAPHFDLADPSKSAAFGGDLATADNEGEVKTVQLDNINEAPVRHVETGPGADSSVKAAPAMEKQGSSAAEQSAQAKAEKPSAVQQNPSFSPASLGSLTNASAQVESSESNSSDSEKLDELPDIGDMGIESSSDSDGASPVADTEIIRDSEFASGGKSFKDSTNQDTSVMAKAIQTILSKDND